MNLENYYDTPHEDKYTIRLLHDDHPEFFDINFSDLKKMKKFGSGSYSVVYKCEYNGELVAAKRIYGDGRSNYKYFSREIKTMRKLNHPNILKFIGVSHKNFKQLYLITEFISGGSLTPYITDKKKRPPWKTLVSIAQKIVKGLIYIDSQSMLYRDLKTDNILVSKDFSVVKICDFGLARDKPKLPLKMTFAGSRFYMAPEIIQGKEYTNTADTFSFGAMLVEFMGVAKFRKSDVVDFNSIQSKKDKLTPVPLYELAIQCLNENPKARPTFTEIFFLLEDLLLELEENVPLSPDTRNSVNLSVSRKNSLRRRSNEFSVSKGIEEVKHDPEMLSVIADSRDRRNAFVSNERAVDLTFLAKPGGEYKLRRRSTNSVLELF